MNTANIFNIQKFSIHDGPGIRTTVFFKGCLLSCLWCHNPESQSMKKQMLYDKDKCTLCGMCVRVCPENAIDIKNNILTTDESRCTYCKKCEVYCIQGARQVAGKEYTVDEVLKEVIKDKEFYIQSKGGVTLSGGEPLVHIDFVLELLKSLKQEGIHTAVDTCGAVNFEHIEKVSKYTDLFLYDLKLMDDENHKYFTGLSNKLILNNLEKLCKIHDNINIRMIIVEGVNADEKHIRDIIAFLKGYGIKNINLLPYHDIAKHKYKKLSMEYKDEKMSKPSDEKMEEFKNMLINEGYTVKIGG